MQKHTCRQSLSLLVCGALFAAIALFTTGCTTQTESAGSAASTAATSEASAAAATASPDTAATDVQVLGEGATVFAFTVVDGDGNQTDFEIHTDAATVGDALSQLGLIEGEESEYGLYVKTVNGITADYDTDGKYWAFYVDDAYAQTGVDATEITDGTHYAFRVE